jgi:hypothetical protein
MANKQRKVWKVVSQKSISGKQTQPKAPFVCWKVVSFWKVNSGKVFSDVW